mgnify:CR=1 FL=1
MNFSKTTDENGVAVFTLPEGDYRFRADAGGTQYWSSEENDCTLPGCSATTVTTSKPVTVSVVDSFGAAMSGLNVYAFNGTTYAGYSKVSDEYGNAVQEGAQIEIGGNDRYVSMCRKHFKEKFYG